MRHGQLTKQKCLVGHSDIELSDYGRKQMDIKLAELFSNENSINQIITSPLIRCQQMAKLYAKKYDILLNVEPKIKEMNFGEWDGYSFSKLWQQKCFPNIGDFWENPWLNSPPKGECMHDFSQRIEQWWMMQLACKQPKTLVISHAGVIKYLLALIAGLDPKQNNYSTRFNIPYAAIIKIEIYQDQEGQAWPSIVF